VDRGPDACRCNIGWRRSESDPDFDFDPGSDIFFCSAGDRNFYRFPGHISLDTARFDHVYFVDTLRFHSFY